MPARPDARAADMAKVAQPVATYGITQEALTFYYGGVPVLVIDRRGFDGLMLRLMIAKMEGG